MKHWLCVVALLGYAGLFSCSGIQTDPTCKVEQYALVVFDNQTDDYKTVAVFRLIHDGERYKAVGRPIARTLPPMVEARLRVHPGMVLICVDTINGKRWMQAYTVEMCTVTRIQMNNPVVLRDIDEIKSRRSLKDLS